MQNLNEYRRLAFESLTKFFSILNKPVTDYDMCLSACYRSITELPPAPKDNPYSGIWGDKPINEQRALTLEVLEEKLLDDHDGVIIEVDYQLDDLIRKIAEQPKRPENRAVYEGLYTIPPKAVAKSIDTGERVDVKSILTITDAGLQLIKEFEGWRATAYPDPGSANGLPITIGYGSTRINGRPVQLGEKITKVQGEAMLKKDVEEFEAAVRKLVKVKLSYKEFSALVSFCYNTGIYNFKTSTLLKELNRGNYNEAFLRQLPRWNKGNNKQVLPGLVRRREAEQKLAGYNT